MQDLDNESMANILRQTHGPQEFDKEKTQQLAAVIANPANSLILLSSQSFGEDTDGAKSEEEPSESGD